MICLGLTVNVIPIKKPFSNLAKEIKQNSKKSSLRNQLDIQKKSFKTLINYEKNLYKKK